MTAFHTMHSFADGCLLPWVFPVGKLSLHRVHAPRLTSRQSMHCMQTELHISSALVPLGNSHCICGMPLACSLLLTTL